MNYSLSLLECDYCRESFSCSIGLSNKTGWQSFSFCCPGCSGILSIELKPVLGQGPEYKLINLTINERFEGDRCNFKIVRLHLDFPTIVFDTYMPFSPYTIATMSLKNGASIDDYKSVTNELNFYSENIEKIQSFFIFYKNKRVKELLLTSKFLLRDNFYAIINLDDDYINNFSVLDNVSELDVDVFFYKSLFFISSALNDLECPDDEIRKALTYLAEIDKSKVCEFRTYLHNNKHLQSSIKTFNKIYSLIYSNEEFFRPSIFLTDYSGVGCKDSKLPLRLANDKVEVILGIYKDLVEVISKQYVLIVGLRNINNNGEYNKFKKNVHYIRNKKIVINNIAEFSSLDLGLKINFMEGCYCFDELKCVSNKIRNAIAHNNWEYDEKRQVVTFCFDKGIVDSSRKLKSESKTILEVNSDIISLFRLMHKLNVMYYLLLCFFACDD
ncbi:hypothetical protein FOC33_01455 [Plesiomonas shigelloides]|uniref:hypothetical protein n=1 Tax=Plesiomonas shigelloides TaxID=703 RepID=UPI00143E9AC7|nr:hypothetical protein [Plesiomonas shigelloides]QIY07720.1 hypothetical protein FOC33_01455 [Plesiomonas shigelloides]